MDAGARQRTTGSAFQQTLYAVRRQVDVLRAVFYRELLMRFARRSWGFMEEVGSIVVHIAVIVAIRLLSGAQDRNGMAILPFAATGAYTYWMFRTGIARVSVAVIAGNRVYSAFPEVTPLDVALTRGIGNVLILLFIALATFFLLQLFGYSGPMRDPLAVVFLLSVAGVFGMGAGLMSAGLFFYVPMSQTVIMMAGLRLLNLVSGTFFVYPDVPPWLRPYAAWNPLLHLNDMLRAAYFPTYEASWASPSYVAIWVVGTFCVGLVVERALRPVIARKSP